MVGLDKVVLTFRLSTVKFTTVQTDIDLRQVRNNKFGDFSTSQLSRYIKLTSRLMIVLLILRMRMKSPFAHGSIELKVFNFARHLISAERRSTLAFCVDLEHVRDMTNAFRRYGVDARFVTSKTQSTSFSVQSNY